MSEHREWCHGVLESEFWTVYRGWRVFVRKSQLGWHWSISSCHGTSVGSVESNRPAAEATAFAAVDRREVARRTAKLRMALSLGEVDA